MKYWWAGLSVMSFFAASIPPHDRWWMDTYLVLMGLVYAFISFKSFQDDR